MFRGPMCGERIGFSPVESVSAPLWWHHRCPGASAHVDIRAVDGPVVAGDHSRGVDLGDSVGKSLRSAHTMRGNAPPGTLPGALAEVTTAAITRPPTPWTLFSGYSSAQHLGNMVRAAHQLRGRGERRGRHRCDRAINMPTNHIATHLHPNRRRRGQFQCAATPVSLRQCKVARRALSTSVPRDRLVVNAVRPGVGSTLRYEAAQYGSHRTAYRASARVPRNSRG
jgi:hypothetical protein